jgi:carbamoyltransferase
LIKNNYVLGLNFLHSDSSACIFRNGRLIAAAEEERFLRIKHTSSFPINSINYCLDEANIDISELNTITINSKPLSVLSKKIIYTLKNFKRFKLAVKSLKNIRNKLSLKDNILAISPKKLFKGKIQYVDHHESHIASSLYYSGFDECVNLSLDGFGDFASSAWGTFRNSKNILDGRVYFPHSMGIFYQAITQFLGFKNYGDEYKVMGLSSYGKPKYEKQISKLLFNTDNGFKLDLSYFIHHNENIIKSDFNDQINYKNLYSQKLINLLGDERHPNDEINQKHIDIAKSAQSVYEKTFFNLLNYLYSKYKISNLTLSGGCAMNSVANGKILKNTHFKKIYISPNPGDAGGAVGSALISICKSKSEIDTNINYAYLGKKFTSEEIENVIKNKLINEKFNIKKYSSEDIFENTVNFLKESKIVGWFQGRMEWGARALGNRSILADARNPNIKEIINSKIKRRESFRPFAPSILAKDTHQWFQIDKEVPFMTEVYSLVDDKKSLLPGITHVDGTGRLQTVSKENNSKYYYLLKKFKERTGVPIILNTSFNENEPIVQNPEEAIDCFIRTNMDVLVLENWIISR